MKHNIYPHRFILQSILVAMPFLLACGVHAALTIGKNDITTTADASQYTYSLTHADMTKMADDAGKNPENGTTALTSGGKIFTDIFEQTDNIRLTVETTGSVGSKKWYNAFINANGGTAQSHFTYKFDFSNAGYKIDSFTVTDCVYAVNQTRSVTTQYSTDGVTWTDANGDLTNVLRSSTAGNNITSGTHPSITLTSDTSSLYYRVVFTSIDGTSNFNAQQSWNRSNGSSGQNANLFSINFSLTPIPEPATVATLLAVATLGLACLVRRNRN